MRFRGDERGQAIQVGAVLLFGVLVVAFASYQAFVVPNQNRGIEFNHNQQVQQQLQDLRNSMLSASDGTGRPVSVTLGTRYPSRVLAINPGPATGALRTQGTNDGRVAAWVNNSVSSGEVGDYWDGTNRSVSTGALVYRPNYNVYDGAPTTIYENTVLTNLFRDANVTVTGQQLVQDDTISLVTLSGNLSVTQSGSIAVDVRAPSASTRTVTVTNETDGNVTIAVATRLPLETWESLLADQRTTSGGHVVDVRTESIPGTGFNRLELELEAGISYDLRMSRVGVGTGVRTPDEAYLTDVVGNGSEVPEGGTQRVVVEVRDRFNNPVSGVRVYANTSRSDSSVRPASDTSDGEGRVEFSYESPADIDGGDESDTLQASLVGDPGAAFDGTTAENVSVELSIENTDGSGTGGGGGGGAYSLSWLDPSGQTGVTCPSYCELNASASSTVSLVADTTPTAIGARVDFAVNDTNVGTVSPNSDTTNSTGEADTTLTAQANGSVDIYASSGADGDVITFNITNVTAGGGGGDTTPPSVDTVSATAQSTDSGGNANNDAEQVEFSFGTGDNDAIDRVLLRVLDKDGNQIASRTVNSASSSSEILTFASEQMQGGGNYLDVNVTAFDASGNRRSCTARLNDIGSTANRVDFDCSSTRP